MYCLNIFQCFHYFQSVELFKHVLLQVTWAGFGKLMFHASSIKHVLLVGYTNGFQVIDVEDSNNFNELLSKRDFPVIFIEIVSPPLESNVKEQISSLHPIILVVEAKDDRCQSSDENHSVNQSENCVSPTETIRFYSFISHCYIRVISFSSPVLMVRSSPRIVAVGLKSQVCIICLDENVITMNLSSGSSYNVWSRKFFSFLNWV